MNLLGLGDQLTMYLVVFLAGAAFGIFLCSLILHVKMKRYERNRRREVVLARRRQL